MQPQVQYADSISQFILKQTSGKQSKNLVSVLICSQVHLSKQFYIFLCLEIHNIQIISKIYLSSSIFAYRNLVFSSLTIDAINASILTHDVNSNKCFSDSLSNFTICSIILYVTIRYLYNDYIFLSRQDSDMFILRLRKFV